MNRSGFQHMLDAHGPDPARWPARQHRAAEALLARSAEARAALREAEALAVLLDAAAEPRRVPAATEIVARATAHAQDPALDAAARAWRADQPGMPAARPAGWLRPHRPWLAVPLPFGWMPAGALAACLVLGLALGAALPPPASAGAASASDIIGLANDGPDSVPGEDP